MPRTYKTIDEISSGYGGIYQPETNECLTFHDETEKLDCAWGEDFVLLGEDELREFRDKGIMRINVNDEFAVFIKYDPE